MGDHVAVEDSRGATFPREAWLPPVWKKQQRVFEVHRGRLRDSDYTKGEVHVTGDRKT